MTTSSNDTSVIDAHRLLERIAANEALPPAKRKNPRDVVSRDEMRQVLDGLRAGRKASSSTLGRAKKKMSLEDLLSADVS